MINKKNRSFAFFDLADPAKRTKENILKAVDLIKIFETKFKVILSLNESEVYKISKCLDIDNNLSSDDSLKNTSELIYKTLKISMLLIHKKTEAFAFSDNKYTQVSIPLCKSPLITTGAGDNFNAGFSLGMLSGASLYSSLIMACACAGFYIRSGRSANKEDLCDFLDKWDKGNLN
jgi:sugar/nucleoside kinase (ribokinase family)